MRRCVQPCSSCGCVLTRRCCALLCLLQEAHECVMQALVIARMMLGEVHPLLAEAYKCVLWHSPSHGLCML